MNNPTIPNTSALINWTNFLMMPYEIEVLTETSFIDEQIVTLLESDIPFIHNVDGNQLLVPYNKSTLQQQSKLTPDFLEKPITSQKQLLDYLEEMIGGGFCFMCSIKGGMKSNFTSDNCCNDTIIRGPLFKTQSLFAILKIEKFLLAMFGKTKMKLERSIVWRRKNTVPLPWKYSAESIYEQCVKPSVTTH